MANETLTKEQLTELIEAVLPPNATRDQLHAHVRGQQKLLKFFASALANHGTSIIQLREMQAAQGGAIEFLADAAGAEQEDEGPLAAIRMPQLVGPDGRKLS